MRRFIVSLLALTILLLGGGVLSWVHNYAHDLEDRAAAVVESGSSSPTAHEHGGSSPHPIHDESNCFLHAQLAAFVTVVPGIILLLISLGLIVAFVTMLSHVVRSLQLVALLDCRGPPVA